MAFFWEGIDGAIVALAALVEQVNVLVKAHGDLNPFIIVFVFVGACANSRELTCVLLDNADHFFS